MSFGLLRIYFCTKGGNRPKI